jgi:hypothetical protein
LHDFNIRVYRWSELDSLAGQVGRIRHPAPSPVHPTSAPPTPNPH